MHISLINIPSLSRSKKCRIDPNIRIEHIAFPDNVEDNISIDTDFHKRKYGFPLSNSEIMNFMSHRRAWKQFSNSNEQWCMVLEDHVDIRIEMQEIHSIISELPEDWELFFPYNPLDYRKDASNKKPAKILLNPNSREIWDWEPYLMGFRWGNSVYFISRKGAEKLLAIDIVKQRLDDEILSLAFAEELNIYSRKVDWFDYLQLTREIFDERIQLIWKAIIESSSWTPSRKERVRNILKVMSEIADKLNIDLVLQGGTHLGYIRHDGIMPWDDDVDIGIEENKAPAYLKELSAVDGISYGEVIEAHTGTPFYKIWHQNGENIDNYAYTFPFVDLWLFNKKNNDLVFKNGIICSGSASQELVEVIFEGAKFKIPYNSIEVLDTRYKDWKETIRVYTWSHCCEKHKFFPFNIDIEVDATGRIVILKGAGGQGDLSRSLYFP